jgi:hypothetical protein
VRIAYVNKHTENHIIKIGIFNAQDTHATFQNSIITNKILPNKRELGTANNRNMKLTSDKSESMRTIRA